MNRKTIPVLLVFVFAATACAAPGNNPPLPQASPTALPVLMLPIATPGQGQQQEEILQKIKLCASDYNRLVEQEKEKGEYETIVLPDGQDGIRFLGDARRKIEAAYRTTQDCIRELNLEYARLYLEIYKVPAVPDDPALRQARRDELLAIFAGTFDVWLEREGRSEDIIYIYDPSSMGSTYLIVGDTFAKSVALEQEYKNISLALSGISQEIISLDSKIISRVDNGLVSVVDVSAFPYYRAEIELTSYETDGNYFTVYSDHHQIIEIIPKVSPLTDELPPVPNFSIDTLEQQARELIALLAPDVKLDELTFVPGEKVRTYFFRWEDRTKPLLDDGMSYPFVQIGFNENGELLNYINTLPLSR